MLRSFFPVTLILAQTQNTLAYQVEEEHTELNTKAACLIAVGNALVMIPAGTVREHRFFWCVFVFLLLVTSTAPDFKK